MEAYILIHIRHVPTQDCEALEYALAMAAFDLPVRLLFSGNGVHWLSKQHEALREGSKSPSKLLSACSMYGIDQIAFVDNEGGRDDAIGEYAAVLDSVEASNWVAAAHHVVSF